MKLDLTRLGRKLKEEEWKALEAQRCLAWQMLEERSGAGKDFLGWLDLPENFDRDEFTRIEAAAKRIRENSEVLVVAGIGGSYLGARAVIEALRPAFPEKDQLEIVFAGQNMSADYLASLLRHLENRALSVNVISKSGTTTETAVAFRFFRELLEKRYGQEEAARRIYATTDKEKGVLKQLAAEKAYESFVVPDDIGGRYSVLSAVGLLPIAAAGIDIRELLAGAAEMRRASREAGPLDCLSSRYAAARCLLSRRGYQVEVLANFEPALHSFGEWWKQLFGESEGKDGKGIFPAAADYSTDLHSLGQFMQDGRRMLFESFLHIEAGRELLPVPADPANADGLAYVEGMDLKEIQRRALFATELAHEDGGCPNLRLELPVLDARNLGSLIYFFEKACALSAYLEGVNPFDQPGVEAYKKNMFALLGRPGYEELAREMESRR